MYLRMRVCACLFACISVCVYLCVFVHSERVCAYLCVFVPVCFGVNDVFVPAFVCICVCACLCVCLCLCLCVRVFNVCEYACSCVCGSPSDCRDLSLFCRPDLIYGFHHLHKEL